MATDIHPPSAATGSTGRDEPPTSVRPGEPPTSVRPGEPPTSVRPGEPPTSVRPGEPPRRGPVRPGVTDRIECDSDSTGRTRPPPGGAT